ncbi:ChaN family lipoprotein [Neisseria leonii]|uniref:ChaN family lipoprotein n=1 Tax=Neisseria leonii TaxID=2995413 RepID=UPI00237A8B7D|nr:ChaN family lipoprotein [Neisseria sp. 3986]MDD9326268.1 ChaN family lipoprotein [Neisseria sp. 3986]
MNTYLKKWSGIIILYLLSAAAAAQVPAGRIYDTAAQTDITAEALVQALAQSPMVIIGEKHDETAHHQAELWLLQQTETPRSRGSVLLEMLDTAQQRDVTRVQQWLLDGGSTSERRLPEKMAWNHAWNWPDYASTVSWIMRRQAKVLAAAPGRDDVRRAAAFVPDGRYSGAPAVRQALEQIIGTNHTGTGNTDKVSMQQFKDSTMAQNLAAAPRPAWLLTGSIHASKQLGIPLFLRDAGKASDAKVLILTTRDSDIDTGHGDYIWYLDPAP